MQKCLDHGKVYFGDWPRREGEDGREYLDRLYSWASRGCLIPSVDAALGAEGGFLSGEEILDYWYSC